MPLGIGIDFYQRDRIAGDFDNAPNPTHTWFELFAVENDKRKRSPGRVYERSDVAQINRRCGANSLAPLPENGLRKGRVRMWNLQASNIFGAKTLEAIEPDPISQAPEQEKFLANVQYPSVDSPFLKWARKLDQRASALGLLELGSYFLPLAAALHRSPSIDHHPPACVVEAEVSKYSG